MKCVRSIHFIRKIPFKMSFIHDILFMVQDQHGLQSQFKHWGNCWTAGGQAFNHSSCSWFHAQVLVYFNLKYRFYWMCVEIIPFFSASNTWIKLAVEILCSKAFSIKQIIITLTINSFGACILPVHIIQCFIKDWNEII